MQPEDPIIVPAESDAELAAVAAASARVDSWGGTTVDDLRHFRSLVPETRTFLALVAGEAAGYGTVGAFPGTEGEPHVTAAFGVVPELRRRGVGSALHRVLSEHAPPDLVGELKAHEPEHRERHSDEEPPRGGLWAVVRPSATRA